MQYHELQLQWHGHRYDKLAGPHLISAARFAQQACNAELAGRSAEKFGPHFDETKSNVVASVFLVVASAEAWAGEIATSPDEFFAGSQVAGLRVSLSELLTWSSVAKKYSKLSVLAGGSQVDFKGDPQFADVHALVELRNKLVHFHPEEPTLRNDHALIDQLLGGKSSRSPLLDASAPLFPDAFASYACARWAVHTARTFMESFASAQGWSVPWARPIHADKLNLPK